MREREKERERERERDKCVKFIFTSCERAWEGHLARGQEVADEAQVAHEGHHTVLMSLFRITFDRTNRPSTFYLNSCPFLTITMDKIEPWLVQ